MQLKLKKSICFSAFVSVFFFKEKSLFLVYTAALIHECAHLCTACFLGITPQKITVGLFGIKLTLPQITSSKEKILIFSSGPIASFALWAYLFAAEKLFYFDLKTLNFFSFANFVIGIVNLLPVFPLDGGAILKSVLTMHSGIINGAKKCRFVSAIVLVLVGILDAFLLYLGIFNPSVAAIFLFLVFNRSRESAEILLEKQRVLSGEVSSRKKLKYIACDAKSELLCLAEYISGDYTLVAATFLNEKFFCDLTGNDIIKGIQKYGALCTVRDYTINERIRI